MYGSNKTTIENGSWKMKRIVKALLGTGIVAVGSVAAWDSWVTWRARRDIYDDVDAVPHHRYGLVLGTGPVLANGAVNHYYKYRIEAAALLYQQNKIDVIVVSGLSRLSYCPEEILQTMELLQSFQVQIDCIGYGILDYARLKQYLMHTWEKQEQFEQDLDAYLCSCCTREGI